MEKAPSRYRRVRFDRRASHDERTADDAAVVPKLLEQIEGDLASFTADSAYDTIAIYDVLVERGATVVVPPMKTAAPSKRCKSRSTSRDRTIRRIQRIGRRRWKKESGYHSQARVENAFFRYKTIIGDRLHARHPDGQAVEAILACNVLNRMTELGRPKSLAIG